MKKLEDLKQGDEFYDISLTNIEKYEYLMIYPFHNPVNRIMKGYHIVIKKNLDEPVRMYYTRIEEILKKQIFTYEDAKNKQIELVESHLKYLKFKTEN